LKLFGTVVRSDAAEKLKPVLVLNSDLLERHEHSNRCAPYRFLEIATFAQLALLILESRA
jgi:hypothetical protein